MTIRFARMGLAAMAASLVMSAPAAAQEAAADCEIFFSASDFTLAALQTHFHEFDGFGSLCGTLRERGFGVNITDGHGQTGETNFATVLVRLFDQRTGVNGPVYMTSTQFTREAAEDIEARVVTEAVISMLHDMAVDSAPFVSSVDTEIARLRTHFGAGA